MGTMFRFVVVKYCYREITLGQVLHKSRDYKRARVARAYYYRAFKLRLIASSRFIVVQNGFYNSEAETPAAAQAERKKYVHQNDGCQIIDADEFVKEYFGDENSGKSKDERRDIAQNVVFARIFPHSAVATKDEQHGNGGKHRYRHDYQPAVYAVAVRRVETIVHNSVCKPESQHAQRNVGKQSQKEHKPIGYYFSAFAACGSFKIYSRLLFSELLRSKRICILIFVVVFFHGKMLRCPIFVCCGLIFLMVSVMLARVRAYRIICQSKHTHRIL